MTCFLGNESVVFWGKLTRREWCRLDFTAKTVYVIDRRCNRSRTKVSWTKSLKPLQYIFFSDLLPLQETIWVSIPFTPPHSGTTLLQSSSGRWWSVFLFPNQDDKYHELYKLFNVLFLIKNESTSKSSSRLTDSNRPCPELCYYPSKGHFSSSQYGWISGKQKFTEKVMIWHCDIKAKRLLFTSSWVSQRALLGKSPCVSWGIRINNCTVNFILQEN